MNHEAFQSSLLQLCCAVPNVYKQNPILLRSMGDLGSLFTVAVILAKQQNGVTLADIQRVVCNRLASARRVRAIVGELERSGAVTRKLSFGDSRRRLIVVGSWFPDILAVWGKAYADSAKPWLPNNKSLTPSTASDWTSRFLAGWVSYYGEFGFLLADGYPVVLTFLNHLAGHVMLLEIIGSAVALDDGTALASFSRKAAAHSLDLSRAHFAAILAKCEKNGWMKRLNTGTHIILAEAVYRELRRWVAREIAWVVELMAGPNA